jgi:hypothetical protein
MENEEEQGEQEDDPSRIWLIIGGMVLGVVTSAFITFLMWPTHQTFRLYEGVVTPVSCPEGYHCHTELIKKTPEENIEDLQAKVGEDAGRIADLESLPSVKKEKAELAEKAAKAREAEEARWRKENGCPNAATNIGPCGSITFGRGTTLTGGTIKVIP